MPKYLTALPDSGKGWCLYSGAKTVASGRELEELMGKRTDVVIGYPTALVSTFSVTLPTSDSSLFDAMAYAQIEKRGLGSGSHEATVFDYDIFEQREGETVLVVHVVRKDLPDDLIHTNAAGYAPSALLRTSPNNGCVLWQEHKRYVLAVFHDAQLVHTQVLSGSGDIGASTAQELNLTFLSLQADEVMEGTLPTGCLVTIAGLSREQQSAFSETLNIPVTFGEGAATETSIKIREKLTPHPVVLARKRRKALRRNLLIAALGLVVYAITGFFVWKSTVKTREKIAALEEQIAIIEPDVRIVQEEELRWRSLDAAFDMKFFPVVQLSRVTSALPGSGVVVREFRTSGKSIRVRGQARDVQLANRLLEDLNAMDEFAGYQWNMPNPKVENDNTASFEIEGKPVDAGTDS